MAANEGRSRKDGIFYMAKSNRSGVWQRTMVIVGFVLVLGFGAVITNLVRLQLVNGETLKTDAVDQSLQSTQLTPSRGTIYDATGTKVLAQSASVWTVALEPNYIDEGDDVKIAKGLSEILGLDYDAVLKKAQQNSYFVYVKRKVETEVRDEIVQYIKDEKIGRGITLMEDYKRYYPYGTTASTVLGFTGTDNQGLAGVETEYDSELSGTAGRLVSAKNAQTHAVAVHDGDTADARAHQALHAPASNAADTEYDDALGSYLPHYVLTKKQFGTLENAILYSHIPNNIHIVTSCKVTQKNPNHLLFHFYFHQTRNTESF